MCCSLQFGGVDLDPETAVLWFAGKALTSDKLLSDYVGRNERTKAVVKLQKKGQGAPSREPVSPTEILLERPSKGFYCFMVIVAHRM